MSQIYMSRTLTFLSHIYFIASVCIGQNSCLHGQVYKQSDKSRFREYNEGDRTRVETTYSYCKSDIIFPCIC